MVMDNTDRTFWTDADFDELSWHDCLIHAIRLEQDGEYQNDLILDLDFVMEWIPKGDDEPINFRVAPAILRFEAVRDLRYQILLDYKQSMELDWIERGPSRDERWDHPFWTLHLHGYPQRSPNEICFHATGFRQKLSASPVYRERLPYFSWEERNQLIKENGE